MSDGTSISFLAKTIRAALKSWESLDDSRKGIGFAESVSRLSAWAEELERESKAES